MPFERQQVTWHKPFCLDLHEDTFRILKTFLEKYSESFYDKNIPAPFPTMQEHNKFVHLCLKILCTHLSLAVTGGLSNSVLGEESKSLRTLLFRLIDIDTPQDIKDTVLEMVSVGAGLLLPQLKERMELLHSLLPAVANLTVGQKMLLDIILNSLEDHSHVAALLGYNTIPEKLDLMDINLTESLMTTLLENLNLHTNECLESIAKGDGPFENLQIKHLSTLLSNLQNHLLAYCSLSNTTLPIYTSSITLLEQHLLILFPLATETFKKAGDIMEKSLESTEALCNVILESLAGAMLLKILNSLLLLPNYFQTLLFSLLEMLTPLDRLNSLFPDDLISGKF